MNKKTNFNKLICLSIILFLFNSTIFCFLVYPKIDKKMNLKFDDESYQRIAFNILSGKGVFFDKGDDPVLKSYSRPTLLRAPLYPYFIAFVYYIFGFKPKLLIMFHIMVNLSFVYIVSIVAKEVFNEKTAILSSFILSLYPPFIWYLSRLYNENLFNFLLALSMLYAVKIFSDFSLKNSIILGFLVGLTSLCKGQVIVFPLVLLPGLIYVYKLEMASLVKRFSLILILMLITIS